MPDSMSLEEEQKIEDDYRSCNMTPKPSADSSHGLVRNSSSRIVLTLNHLGHCPSFKNNKMLVKGKLITDPKKQKWMNQAIQQLKSQLLSASQTTEGETLTAEPQPSSTALLMRLKNMDDCRQWVPEIHVRCEIVEKGQEGVDIVIEEL